MSNNDLIARAELAEEALERVKAYTERMRRTAEATMFPDTREVLLTVVEDLQGLMEGQSS